MLKMSEMLWFWSMYFSRHPDEGCSYYIGCPLKTPAKVLKQFPSTTIISASHDILLDENVEFAMRLKSNGVPTKHMIFNGTIHGFFGVHGFPSSERAIAYAASELRAMINQL
jgi:acetyl esterase